VVEVFAGELREGREVAELLGDDVVVAGLDVGMAKLPSSSVSEMVMAVRGCGSEDFAADGGGESTMGWSVTEAIRAGRLVSAQMTWPMTAPVGSLVGRVAGCCATAARQQREARTTRADGALLMESETSGRCRGTWRGTGRVQANLPSLPAVTATLFPAMVEPCF